MATGNTMESAPTSVSLAYAAALGVQSNSGANSSHKPSPATVERAHPASRDKDNSPNSTISAPVTTSLMVIHVSDYANPGPVGVTSSTACIQLSAKPRINGLFASHSPNATFAKWHHSVR